MSLTDRLRRLELGSDNVRCPDCGLDNSPTETYEVIWGGSESADPEWCETCGRQTLYIVRWADVQEVGLPEFTE